MLTPQVAFALAYAPARLAALHSQQTLLAELARDPAVAGDEKLAQAVSFGSKALSIELGLAKRKLDEVLATAHGAGMPLFRAPIDETGWPKFNAATEESVGLVGTATTGLAYRLGKRARDLYTVWARAQRLAYLRQSAANHPALLEAAGQVVAEAAQAWTGLASELRGAASIEKRRERLQKWMDVAAKPDAVTSTHHGAGAFGEITDWLKTLDMLLEGIVKDVPGAGPAPAGAPPPSEDP